MGVDLFVAKRNESEDGVGEPLFLGGGGTALRLEAAAPPILSFNSTTRRSAVFLPMPRSVESVLVSPLAIALRKAEIEVLLKMLTASLGPMPLMLMSNRNISRSSAVTNP